MAFLRTLHSSVLSLFKWILNSAIRLHLIISWALLNWRSIVFIRRLTRRLFVYLSLKSTWRNFFYLLLLGLHSIISLEFLLLDCLLNFKKQFFIWLIQIVFVVLIEIFLIVKESVINGLNELVVVRFKSIFQRSGILVIVPIQSKLRIRNLTLVLRLWEIDLHAFLVCNAVMHRVRMIHVRSINHILNITVFLIRLNPLVLLLHNFLERVGEIAFVKIVFNYFVESWIKLHNWIVFSLSQIFETTHGPNVVPSLWIILKVPSIIVLLIHFWILHQVAHFLWLTSFWSTVITLIDGNVICHKLFDHT